MAPLCPSPCSSLCLVALTVLIQAFSIMPKLALVSSRRTTWRKPPAPPAVSLLSPASVLYLQCSAPAIALLVCSLQPIRMEIQWQQGAFCLPSTSWAVLFSQSRHTQLVTLAGSHATMSESVLGKRKTLWPKCWTEMFRFILSNVSNGNVRIHIELI